MSPYELVSVVFSGCGLTVAYAAVLVAVRTAWNQANLSDRIHNKSGADLIRKNSAVGRLYEELKKEAHEYNALTPAGG